VGELLPNVLVGECLKLIKVDEARDVIVFKFVQLEKSEFCLRCSVLSVSIPKVTIVALQQEGQRQKALDERPEDDPSPGLT